MKRKFAIVVLATTLMLNGNFAYAVTNEETISETTDKINQEETIDPATITEVEPVEPEVTQAETPIHQVPTATEEVQYIKGDQIVLSLDSKQAYINGNPYVLDTPPLIKGGVTYVPLRFVANQILQAEISLDQASGNIVILKEDKKVSISMTSKIAYVNGEAITLEALPIMKNGTTYLPIRFIGDQFQIDIKYNKGSNTIVLTGPNKGPNTKPMASFRFSQMNYVAGQNVQAISTSYDSDGHKLVDKLWCVVGNKTVTNKELSNMFKTPAAGIYTIGLKVQDQYGLWSDWTYEELTVLPNEVPVVTYLGPDKQSYMQGEDINYQYFVDNEPWESITNEKWTYRKATEDVSKAILGKPKALFTEGDYVIALQVDDAYGQRSKVVETTVHITDQVMKKELEFRFTEGSIGDIIDNYQGFNFRDYIDVKSIQKTTQLGTMIMSDSPETVTREGVLYRDKVNGKGRILIHHINSFSDASVAGGNKRVVMVAENVTNKPVTITLSNKAIKGPVSDVLYLGQKVLAEYLTGVPDETITLAPGERKYIYDTGNKWIQGSCISGLMDVQTTGEVTFTMAAVSAGSTLNSMDSMELFLQAVHPRGTFDTVAINYSIDLEGNEPEKLLLGTGEEEWVKGYDALTGDAAQNKGNFGVSYYITITAKQDMGIILNPRATTFRGAIEWKGLGVYNVPNSGIIYSNKDKAVSLGTIKAGETKTLEYMLPNGSAAPVLLGFIPKDQWNK